LSWFVDGCMATHQSAHQFTVTFSGAYKSCILKPKIFCLASYHTYSPPLQLYCYHQDANYDKAQKQSQGSPIYCNGSRSGCQDTCKKTHLRSSFSAGASGSGRTTFVNTLCEGAILRHKDRDEPEKAHIEQSVSIKPVTVGKLLVYASNILCYMGSQNWKRMVCASPSLSWIRLVLVTALTTDIGTSIQ
jgi:hypothetical protein